MDYSFIEHMHEPKVKELLAYLNENLWRVKKFKWQVEMKAVWKEGKIKAEKRLAELSN
jgi:hypothetical protein